MARSEEQSIEVSNETTNESRLLCHKRLEEGGST
jgi:hypothetical protein